MKKILSNHVEELLQNFSFSELNEQDRVVVLEEITEEEYKAYHYILGETTKLKTPVVPQNIQNNLRSELRKKSVAHQSVMHRALNFSIPLWLVLGMSIAGVVLYLFNPKSNIKEETQKEVQLAVVEPTVIYKTDTIYQEIKAEPIIITKEVEKIVYIKVEPKAEAIQTDFASNGLNPSFGTNASIGQNLKQDNYFNDIDFEDMIVKEQQGRTVEQDKELMDLVADLKLSPTIAN